MRTVFLQSADYGLELAENGVKIPLNFFFVPYYNDGDYYQHGSLTVVSECTFDVINPEPKMDVKEIARRVNENLILGALTSEEEPELIKEILSKVNAISGMNPAKIARYFHYMKLLGYVTLDTGPKINLNGQAEITTFFNIGVYYVKERIQN